MTNMSEIQTRAKKLSPIDENVQLPAAIRAAAARSNALHQKAYEEPTQQNAEPKAGEGENGGEGKQKEADTQAQAEPKTGAENTPAPAQGDEDWQHKYNSLKGRYDRQDDTIRQLNGRISQLEGLLSRASATPAPEKRTAENTFKAISPEDREAYGDDFLDVAARAAQEKLSPEMEAMRRELNEMRGQLSGVAQRTQATTQQTLQQFMDSNLKDWRTINRDPKFIAWTNLPDPYSGAIRINMLKDAYEQGDAQRVLRFFQGYLTDEATMAPAPGNEPETPRGKVPLETFAAPGRAKAPATTQVPGEKETISRAQIAAFYLDVQKGKYRGNDAEKDRLERMIFAAEAEGRVV